MIARLWTARTATAADADAYQALFPTDALAHLGGLDGFVGAWLLRRDTGHGAEVATLTLFNSLDSVRAFGPDDPEAATVSAPARAVLADVDERVRHFTVVHAPL